MKTKIALAVSAALLTAGASASNLEKYNLTNQTVVEYQGIKATKQDSQTQQASAWLIKLRTPSISQLSRASNNGAEPSSTNISASQTHVRSAINKLGADIKIIASTSILVNALIVDADRSDLNSLLSHPEVDSILPIYDTELDVADSADYVKATPVIAAGIASGAGQRVAILDTGVDYTHKSLGGSGDIADYEAAVANKTGEVDWPQGKIIGGYDFYSNDPNPIDATTNHGTHVSHSVLGISPDAELYVYSVCAGGCPGAAQLRALEAAMDPNGDGSIRDRVNTVNMSLGGDFGDTQGDAVGAFIDEIAKLGVNLVISAGNDGATPFVVGGPSTTPSALSVGAMTHPAGVTGSVTSMFAGESVKAYTAGFNVDNEFSFDSDTATLVYPEANQDGCIAFGDDIDFTGQAVIIDRGGCAFTQKVISAQEKGAVFVIVANNKVNDGAFNMGGADENATIPAMMISKEDGDVIKAAMAAEDFAYSINSVSATTEGAIASFTSRGPSIAGTLKPEITAPGTNIMTAHPGLGDGMTPISGTSFSGPITAGAMSIVKEALPDRNAFEIKATLMNAANLNVTMEHAGADPDSPLAPISYIGAGIVDVEKSVNLPVIAMDKDTNQAALAFGLLSLSEIGSFTKTLRVKNFSDEEKSYSLVAKQRYMNDSESGAVSFDMPDSVTVPAGQTVEVEVTATVDPTKLPEWTLTSSYELDGSAAEASSALTLSEYDGAIKFMDGDNVELHVVYHILPKAAASASVTSVDNEDGLVRTITNTGATSINEPFAIPLTGTSDKDSERRLDLLSVSTELLLNPNCDSGISVFNTFGMRDPVVHSMIGSFNADFDTNNDGEWDYTVKTVNLKWFNDAYPRSLYGFVTPYGAGSGTLQPAFHVTGNSFITNMACFEDLGLEEADLGTSVNVRYRVEEADWAPVSTGTGDEVTVSLPLVGFPTTASIVDAEGNEVEDLNPGENGTLVINNPNGAVESGNQGFVILSDSGAFSMSADTTDEGQSAPVVDAFDAMLDKGTEAGSTIGQIMASDVDTLSSPLSEFIVLESSSNMLVVTSDGMVKLSDDAVIDQSTETMTAKVVAIDTMQNMSEPAMVMVSINNTTPTVTLEGVSVQEGSTATLSATAADVDGDSLTYTWTQTSGNAVEFTQDAGSISFTAPAGAGSYGFSVMVSDQRVEAEAAATVTVTAIPAPVEPPKKKKSSGSLGWLALVLAPMAILRRRRK